MANRPAPALVLRDGDREELVRLTRSSRCGPGLAQRARIVLLAADGVANTAIAERVGVSRPTVIAWRDRYQAKGIAGLRDEDRVGPATHGSTGRSVIAVTLTPPPKKYGVTHWSSRLLARHLRISDAHRGRAWREYGVQPWRGRVVPVLHRPRAGGEGRRRRRALPRPAAERGRAVRGREVPDPGAGPDRADPADAAAPDRTPLPRLRPARHHHPVRRPGGRHRQGHRRAASRGTATASSSRSSSRSTAPTRPRRRASCTW